MLAVNGKRSTAKKRVNNASVGADDRLVLPRPLRRVFRFCASLATGRIHIPAHTGTASTLVFFSAVGLYGMSLGGHTELVAQATTSAAGFAVEDVKVSGNLQTSEIEVFQLLGLDGATSLIALDVNAARKKLTELPWVEDVEVRKVYPKTIEVRLKERQAFGIWQHGSELSLIEKSGSVIAPLRDNKYAGLPLSSVVTPKRALQVSSTSWPTGRKSATAFALMCASPVVAGICISTTGSSSSCRKKMCRRRCSFLLASTWSRKSSRAMSQPLTCAFPTAPRCS